MSLPGAVLDCSVCARLCRDVCPVAVHGFAERFVPSEKMRSAAAVLGHPAGVVDLDRLRACTDCGACSDYCLYSVPVAPWLDAALKIAEAPDPTPPPADPAAQSISAVTDGMFVMSTCTPKTGPARERPAATGPNDPPGAPAAASRSDDFDKTATADVKAVLTALGSTCCGQRLSPDVGGDELRLRMGRAMLVTVVDGSTVCVKNPDCAAHLQRCAGDRLQVRVVASEDPP